MATEWRPIETADKNGDGFILWCGGIGPQMGVWDRADGVWITFDGRPLEDYPPTHWAPLPEPPGSTDG